MSRINLQLLAVLKSTPALENLSAPSLSLISANRSSVKFEIIRTDSRGETLRWEIGANPDLSGGVDGLAFSSGSLPEGGEVELTNNGEGIESFYLRVRDTNRPGFIDGIAPVIFVSIDSIIVLPSVNFTLSATNDSKILVDFEKLELPGVKYSLDYSIDQETWTLLEDDLAVDEIFDAGSLVGQNTYYFRITASGDPLYYTKSTSIKSIDTTGIPDPKLPTPKDITFVKQGTGEVLITVVYDGPEATHHILIDGIQVYVGPPSPFLATGILNNEDYLVSAYVSGTGYEPSDEYSENYLHQETPPNYLTIEQFGGNGYYKRFDLGLTYTDLGNNTTRITSSSASFTSEDLNKSFCGLYAHKNPATVNPQEINKYYPNVEGSRYSRVIQVESATSIIVDFGYNLNRSNWAGYIFHDNSKAFSDLIDSYFSSSVEEIRFQSGKTYVIPQFKKKVLPIDKPVILRTISTQPAKLKVGYEDYFKWGDANNIKVVDQDDSIFVLTASNQNFITYNIHWIPPHRRIAEAYPQNHTMFSGAYVAAQHRIVALINNDQTSEYNEIPNGPLKSMGNFNGQRFGFAYAGGEYSGSGKLEDVSDYFYVLMKNVSNRGATFTDFKANMGGGLYHVIEDCYIESLPDPNTNNPWFQGKIKLTTDKTGFHSSITSRNYYPPYVFELTSGHSFYQAMSYNSVNGFANASACIQIGGFVFWIPVGNFWANIYEQWYSRGAEKKTDWKVSVTGSEHLLSNKHMCQWIPRSGQNYTIGRSYTVQGDYSNRLPAIKNYIPDRVRGNINWSAVLNKKWDQINSATEVPANSYPLVFQPGDRFTIVGQGATVYTVIRTDRIDYSPETDWIQEPSRWGTTGDKFLAYYASEYFLDKPLPEGLGLTFQINVVESKAEVLFDGVERDCRVIDKGNHALRAGDIFLPGYYVKNHDINTTFADGNIASSSNDGDHGSYNHQQLTMWAKNYTHIGFYRQSGNSYATPYTVTTPTGQVLAAGPLRKYSKGYTLINSTGFTGQFNPVEQFMIRDLLRKSEGINLPENQKEKVRFYNVQNLLPAGPYVEVYPNATGAPDMPTPCRQLLNSL